MQPQTKYLNSNATGFEALLRNHSCTLITKLSDLYGIFKYIFYTSNKKKNIAYRFILLKH